MFGVPFCLLGSNFKVENDVQINESSVRVWIFKMLFVLRDSKVQNFRFGAVLIIYSSAEFRPRIPIDVTIK